MWPREPSEQVRRATVDLVGYLGKITGATLEVTAGEGERGLAVGLPAHFPKLACSDRRANPKPAERDACLLRTHRNGACLLGATEQGVEHAVRDFLYLLARSEAA